MTYKLVCFDIDGTLISDAEGTYWERLHRELEGVEGSRKQAARAARFRAGKLTYKEWVDRDLGDLKARGTTREEFVAIARSQPLMPGSLETLRELRRRGVKLAVIAGSLNVLVETLFPPGIFDEVFINEVLFDERGRIASWTETVYDEGTKHRALRAICARESITLSETVFVGDGENDRDILRVPGLGIAFCPKSDRVAAADVVIRKRNVREVLRHVGA